MLSIETLRRLAPEIILVITAVVLYLRGAFARSGKQALASSESAPQDIRSLQIALMGVVVAAWALDSFRLPTIYTDVPILDSLGVYLQWFALGTVGLLILLAVPRVVAAHCPEYPGTLLLVGAGVMAVAEADNLLLLFVALEMVSIPTYILLCLGREDSETYEAAAKYFFLSLVASALVLYGMSFLYGATGVLGLREIREKLMDGLLQPAGLSGLAKLGMVFLLAGLGFKIAAVPFHFYAPDVYQGTTYPNAALLSVAPKIAGFTALLRILVEAIPLLHEYAVGWRVVLALAILTMTLGNVVALWQDHLRRLLAYSSIGQAGYILAALAVGLGGEKSDGSGTGLAAVLLYLVVYAVATIGAFAVLEGLRRNSRAVERLDDLGGLARERPWVGLGLAIFMFSLAGVPPLAGFWGKWAVVLGAIQTSLSSSTEMAQSVWFLILAVVTMLNAAVAAAYYLRVVAIVYFRSPSQKFAVSPLLAPWTAVAICGLLSVGIGLVPWPLWNASSRAVEPLVSQGPASPDQPAELCHGISDLFPVPALYCEQGTSASLGPHPFCHLPSGD